MRSSAGRPNICSSTLCTRVPRAAGALGGWEEGDQTGRQYVPGKVAVVSCEPRELDRPPEQIATLSWDRFRDFLWCGQQYE